MLSPASDYCQRWRDGRHSWRHRSDGGFDRALYEVAAIPDDTTAKAFVVRHHYSGSYPAAVHRYGLYRATHRADPLVGVLVLSVPPQATVLTGVFPDLEAYTESLELGRLVLLDGPVCPANSETFFVAEAFRLAAAEGIRGIVSFSDPVARYTARGAIVMPGHVGIVYQASNARYCGRATARTVTMLPDGTILNGRSMQKIRRQERGHDHVERLLRVHGAPVMAAGEKPTAWLARALDDIGARSLRHAGNHRYAFAIGPGRRHIRIGHDARPYPKEID